MSKKEPGMYSSLVLAYIGDSVYELYVRDRVIEEHPDMPAHKLHIETVKHVSAENQSKSIHAICGMLTEKENQEFIRGRNAKSPTASKNASLADYKYATGFEALLGYLYLGKEYDRLKEIMEAAYGSNDAHN